MTYIGMVAILYGLWRMYIKHKNKAKKPDDIVLLVGNLILISLYYVFRRSLVSDISQLAIATLICWYLIRRTGWKRAGF
ncbi:MAG TPA: hypothetical protein VFD33_03735 [Bacillota bacterium]|nr:hypothetical protein [Bacillota bacterium]